jgi:hypothetical protein
MTLGTAGVSGNGPDTFNGPTDVAVAANGDIFVSDGHVNSRIVKFSKDGKFITSWGKKGSGPGEFDLPHTIFFDSRGRLLVGDRSNKRIQIFDQDGKFLDQWTQFGSPSGIFIAPDDTLYVVDYNDKMRLFIGSAKDGSIKHAINNLTLAEGVAVDRQGNIYVGEHPRQDRQRDGHRPHGAQAGEKLAAASAHVGAAAPRLDPPPFAEDQPVLG